MKRIIVNGWLMISMGVFYSCASHKYTKETLNLHTVQVDLSMEQGVKRQIEYYEEGVVYAFSFRSGGVLLILQGPLMKTPIDDFKPSTSLKDKHLIEKGMDKKGLKWRRDTYSSFRVCYFNVIPTEERKFDRILNGIKFKATMCEW